MGLFLYLPMSTFPGLEMLSEEPTPITFVMGLSLIICIAIMVASDKRQAFNRELRHVLFVGTIASVLGVTAYGTYVYAFSQTLAGAKNAPKLGELAPDFSVVDPEGRSFTLSETRGAPVLLVFYRGQW